jgi:hypothetical protein
MKDLVRYYDSPAMQDNPLYITMFPNSSPKTKEEEIMWHISSLYKSFGQDLGPVLSKSV